MKLIWMLALIVCFSLPSYGGRKRVRPPSVKKTGFGVLQVYTGDEFLHERKRVDDIITFIQNSDEALADQLIEMMRKTHVVRLNLSSFSWEKQSDFVEIRNVKGAIQITGQYESLDNSHHGGLSEEDWERSYAYFTAIVVRLLPEDDSNRRFKAVAFVKEIRRHHYELGQESMDSEKLHGLKVRLALSSKTVQMLKDVERAMEEDYERIFR